MKKILLTMLAVVLAAGTMTATTTSETKHNDNTSINYIEPSTFCKLIRSGNYEAVKAMVENGTNINRKSTGLTPAMFAARYNRADILKLLIKNGAKLQTKSNRGYTALDYAKMSKAHEAYAVLKEALDKK